MDINLLNLRKRKEIEWNKLWQVAMSHDNSNLFVNNKYKNKVSYLCIKSEKCSRAMSFFARNTYNFFCTIT